MAIAARFNLELKQYNAVNAFVNAILDEEMFIRMAPRYREPGKIYQLNKALYGLRRSPLLWQKELTSTLTKLGFKAVPHELCCILKSGIILFFYVDNIVVTYKKSHQLEADSVMNQLRAKYKISGGGDLEWFLVSTQPDVAFTISRLSRFLLNPRPKYHQAADKVLCYLKRHRAYTLRLGGGEDYSVLTDASFADNTLNYKSSQVYIMTLFGGTIGCKQEYQKFLNQIRVEDTNSYLTPQQKDMENPDIEELLSLNDVPNNL
ncbi:hypothetical protein TSTA_007540 [Talaromyces stipitatus ATCC 10500]|uniref:Reverse transcriptase Ty1/copia-type domain-containing protein n=1 Tax=Talaromyces stipitatus (strain ATCC 10500 / CBS 375.48 / QM 6759 / NRRL 1006) TaxID=441959 RepID=B8MVF5_TALSN|nr:uncharacterized protein TSTA_007540 [Talaromyces stipitatus ATCC 10500]EED11464.1 hypothetical protein TSTA_007540 [Talaromyces stipitatus ATCC 10500]